MINTVRAARMIALASLLALLLAACVPGQGPQVRILHGQTWGADFNVRVQPFGLSGFDLPVRLELDFSQRLTQIDADASLAYNVSILRINAGDLDLSGRLGLDDSLYLSNSDGLLQFDGRFIGDRLVGTGSVGGLVPVGDVVFSRVR